MSGWMLLVIGWLALSGLTAFVRGIAEVERRYTPTGGVFALIEVGFFIWVVAVKL